MIVYRIQVSKGKEWIVQWEPLLAEAKRSFTTYLRAGYEVHLDKIEILSSRDDIAAALNHAQVNRINWPGEQVLPRSSS